MKKILSIFILIGFVIFNACDPMEDIYDEIDAKEEEKGIVSTFEYTLTSDDYSLIADLIEDLSPSDTLDGQFIESFEYFNELVTAQDYIPYLLNNNYPWLGPKSAAKLTYNYSGEMAEDLKVYTGAEEYVLIAGDYDAVSTEVGITEFFYPDFNPDIYIADILETGITGDTIGQIYSIQYEYSDVTPLIIETEYATVFEEDFSSVVAYDPIDINGWTQYNEAGTEAWEGRIYDDNGYAQFSAYNSGEASTISWLITPAVDLTTYTSGFLNFTSKDGYNTGDVLTVLISTDYPGTGDPTGSTWVDLNPTLSTGNTGGYASSFLASGDIDIDTYCGSTIYVAFRYIGGDPGLTTTMQIDDLKVKVLSPSYEVIGANDYTVKTFYESTSAGWSKVKGVYHLTSADYKAMGGDPSYDKAFSDDAMPKDYLPNFLTAKYAGAGVGFKVTVLFEYDNGIEDDVFTLAANYEYTESGWESSYDYIAEVTNQFVVSASTNKWVFDPTETVVMESEDFQLIVDYVNENLTNPETEFPENTEGYYGASAFYANFDTRTGKWNSDEFDSWDEAVAEAISTLVLPELYPNAQLQVNGVDMGYRVIFNTYDGTNGTYSMKFQVTKAGPDPEFTLIEGPDLE